jgi:YaiO family outer membrane protein
VRTRFEWGPLLARVRQARRFGEQGEQYELDAYPRLSRNGYLYLNAGWSDAGPYPDRRLGAELYQSFAHGWEGSLGLRHFDFAEGPVTIFTGSLAKYLGHWWLSARPTYTDKESGTSQSLALRARRYFGGSDTWVGLEWGIGDEPSFDRTGFEEARLTSARLRVEGQLAVSEIWTVNGSIGLRERELAGGNDRESTVYRFAIARRF